MIFFFVVNWFEFEDNFLVIFYVKYILQLWFFEEILLMNDVLVWKMLSDEECWMYIYVLVGLNVLDIL